MRRRKEAPSSRSTVLQNLHGGVYKAQKDTVSMRPQFTASPARVVRRSVRSAVGRRHAVESARFCSELEGQGPVASWPSVALDRGRARL